MNLNESLLSELEQELTNTRRTLERVPTDKFDYKPHQKSGTMGWLAGHIANIPMWGAMTLETENLKMDNMEPEPVPPNTEALLSTFDANAAKFRDLLKTASNELLMSNWSMEFQGKTIMSMPKIAVLRAMILNHGVHHRGQLTVYLRMNDIPVPALYGPSADEGAFGASV